MNTYSEGLDRILGKGERAEAARGYELLGGIAIIEMPSKLKKKEKKIAGALMESNKRIETVLAKAGPVHGVYRTRKLRYIAGKRNYAAACKENGCTFRFDVRKVYFSSKLSYERNRIAQLVGGRENVVVMFAGVGPFVVEIAKRHPHCTVAGIELNRSAYDSMKENIRLNKTPNAEAVFGDVKRIYRKYLDFADRIIMPLPASSLEFLDQAFAVAKKKAKVHIYVLGMSETVLADSWKTIRAHAEAMGYGARMLGHRAVRPYSAREMEIAIDYGVEKR